MQKNNRPQRISLKNAQGKKITLASGKDAFARLDAYATNAKEYIICGLGPLMHEQGLDEALPTKELLHEDCKVFYLECAEFSSSLESLGFKQNIPKHWQQISQEELLNLLPGRAHWWYKQNIHLFPDYWSPILGAVQAKLLRTQPVHTISMSVFVAGNKEQLLHKEVCRAFAALGFGVHVVDDEQGIDETEAEQAASENSLRSLLGHEQPSLFFSINLRGLDSEGANFALLQALDIPVVIWFVDNPWHILSALRLPWWKKAKLFVTDASFIPELERQGANCVYHLPLAAAQQMWKPEKSNLRLSTRQAMRAAQNAGCVFVGRASFPEHAKFFAAAKLEQNIFDTALKMLERGERPHFHWWQEQLHVSLWPGHEARHVGLGAETCACAQRVMWLRALLEVRPMIFGDSLAWQRFLPEADDNVFFSNLDYYTELAAIYKVSPCVLNVTSLLLPAGLTQRHFDVWAAGGFLFSDNTAGLQIFPTKLTQHIIVKHPQELVQKIQALSASKRAEIIAAWQEYIQAEHSYEQRMRFVLHRLS